MTDEQIEAACIAYHGASVWNTMPADRIGERESHGMWGHGMWGTNREAERQVMRAALVAVEAAAWRPIAEAPRDGTIIDVWLQESLSDIKFYCSTEPLFIREGVYGGRSAGWFWSDGGVPANSKFRPYLKGLNMPVFVQPTHWMSLPSPPPGAGTEASGARRRYPSVG